jgi:hypothetical protein
MSRLPKISNLLKIVKKKAEDGEFILMPHAVERRFQRSISIDDIVKVLSTGWHEAKKDEFRQEYAVWNYSIRGVTIDKRNLRVVVSFDENNLLVVTVIRLQKR